jgi:hypothetical protein
VDLDADTCTGAAPSYLIMNASIPSRWSLLQRGGSKRVELEHLADLHQLLPSSYGLWFTYSKTSVI